MMLLVMTMEYVTAKQMSKVTSVMLVQLVTSISQPVQLFMTVSGLNGAHAKGRMERIADLE